MILLLADGSYAEVTRVAGCSSASVDLSLCGRSVFRAIAWPDWKAVTADRSRVLTPRLEARILNWTRKKPPSGATHWSTRTLGKHLGVSHTIIARAWQRTGLQPHRLERYMRSNDPDFETKAADIIGLYLKPPEHAVEFCVDEKTQIQTLDRRDPVLPISLPVVRNGTGSNTFATARCLFTLRWKRAVER